VLERIPVRDAERPWLLRQDREGALARFHRQAPPWPGVLAEAVQGRHRQQLAAPSARRFAATELIGRDVPSADARVYAPADSCCWG
jgi:hypothetical protein